MRIVQETGTTIAQVARDLGINSGILANWVGKDKASRASGLDLTKVDPDGLCRLERENGARSLSKNGERCSRSERRSSRIGRCKAMAIPTVGSSTRFANSCPMRASRRIWPNTARS